MKLFLAALTIMTLAIPQFALAFDEGVLKIADDHKIYYKYQKAKAGKETVVLFNGLIYAIEHWDEFFAELSKDGTGALLFAYSSQPESLAQLGDQTPYYAKKSFQPLFGLVQTGLETQTLVDEAMVLINSLAIDRFSVASLSYGSIVASELSTQNAWRINNLILMAPAVVTSGRYNPYGANRHEYYSNLKEAGNIYADHSYDAEIGLTLSALVTPNKYSFDNVSFEDFYNGVYQMARSSKWFDLKEYAKVKLPPTSLFIATLEDEPLLKDQRAFWQMMKQNPAQRNLVTFQGAYHAIPGVAPKQAAKWTKSVVNGEVQADATVKVGTGNPPTTSQQSLLDFTQLTEDAWQD